MAGRGPAPKDPEKRVRRNKEQRTTLPAAPTAGYRDMPTGEWAPATRAWWEAWCRSPQAARFTETAWQRLVMLVPLVERFWRGDVRVLTEIRLNESLLGATPQDLQRLRWDLEEAEAKPAAVTDELSAWKRRRRVVDPAAGTGS